MAVVIGEAVDIGSVFHGFGEIDVLPPPFTLVRLGPVPSKMPFSDHLSMITDRLQQMGNGRPLGRDQVFAGSAQHPAGKPRPPIVSTGEHTVSCRSANGTRGMGVKKGNPLIRHFLEMRGLDPAVRVGGGNVPNAQIIGKNENDVRIGRGLNEYGEKKR